MLVNYVFDNVNYEIDIDNIIVEHSVFDKQVNDFDIIEIKREDGIPIELDEENRLLYEIDSLNFYDTVLSEIESQGSDYDYEKVIERLN
jgi:hypothetical protein